MITILVNCPFLGPVNSLIADGLSFLSAKYASSRLHSLDEPTLSKVPCRGKRDPRDKRLPRFRIAECDTRTETPTFCAVKSPSTLYRKGSVSLTTLQRRHRARCAYFTDTRLLHIWRRNTVHVVSPIVRSRRRAEKAIRNSYSTAKIPARQ